VPFLANSLNEILRGLAGAVYLHVIAKVLIAVYQHAPLFGRGVALFVIGIEAYFNLHFLDHGLYLLQRYSLSCSHIIF
jgi:hypothetical protein